VTAARAEWLVVGGSAEPWERLGLTVVDSTIPLFGTGIRIDPSAPPGLARWALSGLGDEAPAMIDGLVTDTVEQSRPVLVEHPIGAIGLDHVVVVTNDLERTCAAIDLATGSPLRRVREAGPMRQGFHRLGGGGLVVEVVERADLPEGPASFWGLVINVEDLDAAAERIGTDGVGDVSAAVQPGRKIATVRAELGLGLPVALMTP
jgi:predicted enzyme related to lactoylglutathione lyase